MKIRVEKIGFFMLIAMLFCMTSRAQDDAQFTLFPWATSYYNAGGIGEQSNTLCFTGIYHNKYLGWNDVYTVNGVDSMDKTAPQDFLFNVESYLKKLHGSLGVSFISDRIGYYKNVGVKLGYSYKLRIGGGHMGIGAQVTMFNQVIDATGFRPIDEGDPVLSQLSESTLDLDFSLGLFYNCDQWYAGVSVTQLASAFDKRDIEEEENPLKEMLLRIKPKNDLAKAQEYNKQTLLSIKVLEKAINFANIKFIIRVNHFIKTNRLKTK